MSEMLVIRNRILEHGVLDAEGTHHVFASGRHGRKLDLDKIADNDPLYADIIAAKKEAIKRRGAAVLAVLGIANGTNREARDVAGALKADGIEATALYTEKTPQRQVRLTSTSRQWLFEHAKASGFIVAVEDVGTSGGTVMSAVEDVQNVGPFDLAVQLTWQRRETLPELDAANIPYHTLIREELPTYAPDQCRAVGYCADGWELIEHGA